jgi:hypothetical protein
MKNILFIASEAVPFIKTGGLADVVGSLPKCFDKQYFDVRVMIPKYLCIKESFRNEMKYVNHFYMDYLGQNRYVGILEYEYEGVTFYFIDNESYFWGDRPYGDWYYDLEKFSFFCKAALSSLPVIGFKPGPLQAASDSVYITLRGKGTHGGRPHLGVDPIPVAAQIVTALQTIVSRKVDSIESAVVSICSINCGNFKANNVVQSELTMSGTVRTFLPEIRDLAEENIRAMVTGIAAANGCTVELVYDRMIGSVINGEEQTIAAHEVTKALLGEDNVRIIVHVERGLLRVPQPHPRRDHPRGHPR